MSAYDPAQGFDGRCCACGDFREGMLTIVMLDRRLPIEHRGEGWGCFQCNAPNEGAVAVLCDACTIALELGTGEVVMACAGNVQSRDRLRVADLVERFDHDLKMHPEVILPDRDGDGDEGYV